MLVREGPIRALLFLHPEMRDCNCGVFFLVSGKLENRSVRVDSGGGFHLRNH